MSTHKKKAEKYFITSLKLFSKGKVQEAKKEASKAIKLDHSLYSGYELLGWIHLGENSYKEAEKYFSTAYSLIYRQAKTMSFNKAMDTFQMGLSGNLVFMHLASGMHFWMGNRLDEAEESFKSAIKCVNSQNGFIEFMEKIIDLVRINKKFVNLFKTDNLLVFRESLSDVPNVIYKVKDIEKIDTTFVASFPEVMKVIDMKGVCISVLSDYFHVIFILIGIAEKHGVDFLNKIEKRTDLFAGKDKILQTFREFIIKLIESFKIGGSLESIPKEGQARILRILSFLFDVYDTWSKVLPDKQARKLAKDRIRGLYDKLHYFYAPLRKEAEKRIRKELMQEAKEEKAEYKVLRTGKKPAYMIKKEVESLNKKDYELYFNICSNKMFKTKNKRTREITIDRKPKEILIFLIENAGKMYDWLDLRERFFPDKKLPDGSERPYGPEPIHKQMSVLANAIQGDKDIFIKKSRNVPLKGNSRVAYYFDPKSSYCLINTR